MSTTITRRPRLQGFYSQWSALGAYSKLTAVSDNLDTTGIGVTGSATDKDTWFMDPLGIDSLSVIGAVVVVTHDQGAVSNDSCNSMVRFNSTDLISPTFTWASGSFPTLQTNRYNAPRPTGGKFSVNDVDNSEFGFGGHNFSIHATPGGMYLAIEVTYDPVSVQLEQVRDVANRVMGRYSALPDRIAIATAAAMLGIQPADIARVAHKMLPTAEGAGRGSEVWQGLILRPTERELNLDNIAAGIIVRGDDLRDILKRYWDGGISKVEPGGPKDGVVILCPQGSARTYDGPPTVVESPVSGLQIQVAEDVEPTGAHGRLHQGQSINRVLNSSFVSGLTSWSTVAGIPAVAALGTEWWDPSIVAQHLILEGGLVAESVSQAGITAAAGMGWLWLVHRETLTTGDLLVLTVQRASDSFFLNGSLVWQPGATSLTLPNRPAWWPELLGPIDQTAGPTTYTITLATNGATRRVEVTHVQLELARNGNGWASSPIVTTTAAVTRAANSLKRNNDAANRLVRALRGCYRFRYEPLANSADLVSGSDFYLMNVVHDANNWIRVRYDVSDQLLIHERRHQGATDLVSIPLPLVRGTRVDCAITWQGTGGENDDADNTISIWAYGATLAKAIAGPLTESATSDWFAGSFDGATGHCNGFLWDEPVLDYVPTMLENRRWATS